MLLAWDTTDRLNWGARSAHVATHQVLAQEYDEVECLSGNYQTQSLPVDFTLPEWISRPLRRRQERFWGAQAYVSVERVLGARMDYLDPEPSVSLRRILNNLEVPPLRRLHDKVRRHEKIVIDGNGDMIFKDEPKRNLLADLALIELANYFDKEVYYVNSILSDCSITGRNDTLVDRCLDTLKTCDGVSFRDPMSRELAGEMDGEMEAECIPDSLFYWHSRLSRSACDLPSHGDFLLPYTRERESYFGQLAFDAPYICVTGGSRAAFDQQRAFEGYCMLVEQLRQLDLPVYLVPTCYGDRFLEEVAVETGAPFVPAKVPILMGGAILANARLFVTGRYHPSIMAAAGGTPCVFLEADSHKTLSLQHLLDYNDPQTFSAIPNSDEIDDILTRSRDLMNQGQALRDSIQRSSKQCADDATRLTMFVNGS